MSLRKKLLGLNLKCSLLLFTHPITYKVMFWHFRSSCIKDTVWNKTYQNFRDKRLVRPGSECPNWQRSQPISYKPIFSQRYNIDLVDHKYNITYQNIQGKLRSDLFSYQEKPKWRKNYPTTNMDELSAKLRSWF